MKISWRQYMNTKASNSSSSITKTELRNLQNDMKHWMQHIDSDNTALGGMDIDDAAKYLGIKEDDWDTDIHYPIFLASKAKDMMIARDHMIESMIGKEPDDG